MALMETFSGIRGVYGKDLTDDIALKYGHSFAKYIKKDKKKIVIGHDSRKSADNIKLALSEGLNCNIIDVGLLPTPAIQNAVRHFKADGGIIITASHNPKEYNGFKFLDTDGAVLRPEDMQKVIDNFHRDNKLSQEEFLTNYASNTLHVKAIDKRHKESLSQYIKFLKSFFNSSELKLIASSNLKFLVDPNGGAGVVAKDILKEFGLNPDYINLKQSIFKREIEPTKTSLNKSLKFLTGEFLAGFDCDADRVEIMTKDAELISGNHLLALITDDILSNLKHPNEATVVVNDATSYVVKEIAEINNAKIKEVEVGEINVVDAMIGFNSPVGGEGSNGGVIIPMSRCRDGILTLLHIIKIIEQKKLSLSELVSELPEYYYLKEKLKLKKPLVEIRERLIKRFLANHYLVQETGDESGGLKFIKDNSWLWLRVSKTEENVLRLIADSKDIKIAENLIKEGKKALKRIL